MDSPLMTIDEVAAYCRFSRKTVSKWIRSGRLRASDCSDRGSRRPSWRVLRCDVDDLLATRNTTPIPTPKDSRPKRIAIPKLLPQD